MKNILLSPLINECRMRHLLSSQLVIVQHLSGGLNISLPFLMENGLDQLDSQGVLLWSEKQVRFPLYQNMTPARKSLPSTAPLNSVITLGKSTVEVSNKNCPTMPPQTGKLLNTTISEKATVKEQAAMVFSYKNLLINKIHHLSLNKEHPSQDENYFGLKSLDQVVLVTESQDIEVYFVNESDTPLTISSICVIGSINVPESHAEVIDMSNIYCIRFFP